MYAHARKKVVLEHSNGTQHRNQMEYLAYTNVRRIKHTQQKTNSLPDVPVSSHRHEHARKKII